MGEDACRTFQGSKSAIWYLLRCLKLKWTTRDVVGTFQGVFSLKKKNPEICITRKIFVLCTGSPRGMLIRATCFKFSKDKFDVIFGEEKQVLSASNSQYGRALYYCVHNYASRQTAGSQQSVQTLVQKTPPLSGFLVAYRPIPSRDLSLTGGVILHTVVSSVLTGARL